MSSQRDKSEPRVIVITGTRKGLGREMAQKYLQKGDVVVGCSRRSSSLEHQNYRHFEVDVSVEEEVVKMVRAVRKEFRTVDVLINNAGIAAMNHFVTTPFSNAKRVFDTNFFGSFLFSREIAKIMIRRKKGCIINFSTVAVPLNLEGEAVYAASKAAVENFTRIAATELGGFGIRVNAVGPTPIPTDLIRNVPQDKIEKILERQALKRLGRYEDVANVIDFFLDEKSEFVTGQVLYLGGVF